MTRNQLVSTDGASSLPANVESMTRVSPGESVGTRSRRYAGYFSSSATRSMSSTRRASSRSVPIPV